MFCRTAVARTPLGALPEGALRHALHPLPPAHICVLPPLLFPHSRSVPCSPPSPAVAQIGQLLKEEFRSLDDFKAKASQVNASKKNNQQQRELLHRGAGKEVAPWVGHCSGKRRSLRRSAELAGPRATLAKWGSLALAPTLLPPPPPPPRAPAPPAQYKPHNQMQHSDKAHKPPPHHSGGKGGKGGQAHSGKAANGIPPKSGSARPSPVQTEVVHNGAPAAAAPAAAEAVAAASS